MEAAAGEMTRESRARMAAAFFLPIVLLLPFVNRAYNIDEPMFIWVAQQIVEEPIDFFGGHVNRSSGPQPMYEYNQNPPGFSYYLALFGAIGGWSEPVLRIASLLAAGLCSLGTYLVAARLSTRPLFAVALMTLSPAFFVSATTVMTDVGMTACYVWGVYAWLRWMDTGKRASLAASVALIASGVLMKYYAITLVPLLVAYTLLKRRKPGLWMAALVVPTAVLALFFVWSWYLYGVNLLQVAADVAQDNSVRQGDAGLYREIVTLLFIGGCFAPMALCAPLIFRPLGLAAWLAIVAAGMLIRIDGYSLVQLMLGLSDRFDLIISIHVGLMLAAGGILVLLPLRNFAKHPCAEGVLLALWVYGAIVFTAYVNHLINARTLLPLAPAMAIVIARALPEAITAPRRAAQLAPLAAGAVLSLWVAWGDYTVAESGRQAARAFASRAAQDHARLHYSGLWGFQYYLELSGATPFAASGTSLGEDLKIHMEHGDLLAVSSDGREKWRRSPDNFEEVELSFVPNPGGIVTYHPADQAGFYSHLSGILPYKFGLRSREEYGLYRWLGPSYVADTAEESAP